MRVYSEFNEPIFAETQNRRKQVLLLLLPMLAQSVVAELKVNRSLDKIIFHFNSKATKVDAIWAKLASDTLDEGIIVLDEEN